MKHLLGLALTVAAFIPLQSCNSVKNMEESKYQETVQSVNLLATLGGLKLAEAIGPDRSETAMEVTAQIRALVETNQLGSTDVVSEILNRYLSSSDLNLTPEELIYIKTAAHLINVYFGQVNVDVGGELSDREKNLIFALLDGLKSGLELASQ